MNNTLIDTSVWVDFINGKTTSRTTHLEELIKIGGKNIFICPIILQEVLQGIKFDSQYLKLKKILSSYHFLEIDHKQSAIETAELYRELRKKGITIRKINDCMIAHYALFFDLELCHNDSDFDLISQALPLKTVKF